MLGYLHAGFYAGVEVLGIRSCHCQGTRRESTAPMTLSHANFLYRQDIVREATVR